MELGGSGVRGLVASPRSLRRPLVAFGDGTLGGHFEVFLEQNSGCGGWDQLEGTPSSALKFKI
jgi:hypothetical protein